MAKSIIIPKKVKMIKIGSKIAISDVFCQNKKKYPQAKLLGSEFETLKKMIGEMIQIYPIFPSNKKVA